MEKIVTQGDKTKIVTRTFLKKRLQKGMKVVNAPL
jgi:hypothetical protein